VREDHTVYQFRQTIPALGIQAGDSIVTRAGGAGEGLVRALPAGMGAWLADHYPGAVEVVRVPEGRRAPAKAPARHPVAPRTGGTPRHLTVVRGGLA
jgi:hypothetical protein